MQKVMLGVVTFQGPTLLFGSMILAYLWQGGAFSLAAHV